MAGFFVPAVFLVLAIENLPSYTHLYSILID